MRWVVIVFGGVLGIGVAAAAPERTSRQTEARMHARADSAPLIVLDAGTAVCALDEVPDAARLEHQAGWTAIRLSRGLVGYVPADALEPAQAPADDAVCAPPPPPTVIPDLPPPPVASDGTALPAASIDGLLARPAMRFMFGAGVGAMAVTSKAAASQHVGTSGPESDAYRYESFE